MIEIIVVLSLKFFFFFFGGIIILIGPLVCISGVNGFYILRSILKNPED